LGGWGGPSGAWTADPYLGGYGLALATVGAVGATAALSPLSYVRPPSGSPPGVRAGLATARLLPVVLVALLMGSVFVYLEPLEYGFSPGDLLIQFSWTRPSFLAGLLVGLSLPLLALAGSGAVESVTSESVTEPMATGTRSTVRWAALGGLGLLGPVVVSVLLGPAATVGALYGWALTTLFAGIMASGLATSDRDLVASTVSENLEGLLLLAAATILAFGGLWFSSALWGAL